MENSPKMKTSFAV